MSRAMYIVSSMNADGSWSHLVTRNLSSVKFYGSAAYKWARSFFTAPDTDKHRVTLWSIPGLKVQRFPNTEKGVKLVIFKAFNGHSYEFKPESETDGIFLNHSKIWWKVSNTSGCLEVTL